MGQEGRGGGGHASPSCSRSAHNRNVLLGNGRVSARLGRAGGIDVRSEGQSGQMPVMKKVKKQSEI